MDSSSWSGPGTSRTCGWQPGRTAGIAPSARTSGSSSRSSIRTCTSGSRPSAGSSGGSRRPRWRARRTRRSGSSSAPSASDGYLNSYVQVVAPGSEYQDLAWGHELYSFGHLIQAAVAWQRALGDDRLLGVATRAADAVDRELGPAGRLGIDGHPEIEMALVELFRTTGERRYLELAARFVEARGAGPARGRAFRPGVLAGPRSRSRRPDGRRPRRSTAVSRLRRGRRRHRARRSAAARRRDAALAGHDRDPDVPDRRPRAAATATRRSATRTSCRPTAPTPRRAPRSPASCSPGGCCSRRATPIAPTPSNGPPSTGCCPGSRSTAPGSSTSTRSSAGPTGSPRTSGHGARAPWFACACCPPNVMRFLSSWPQYLATADESGVQIHQFATGEIAARARRWPVRIATETGYPWDGAAPGDHPRRRRRGPGPCRCGCPAGADRRAPGSGRRCRAARCRRPPGRRPACLAERRRAHADAGPARSG